MLALLVYVWAEIDSRGVELILSCLAVLSRIDFASRVDSKL